MRKPATKDEVIEALCFYQQVKIDKTPLGGFLGKGWVVCHIAGYEIQYMEYVYGSYQLDKKKALIFKDLFDAVVAAAPHNAEVWAVDIEDG